VPNGFGRKTKNNNKKKQQKMKQPVPSLVTSYDANQLAMSFPVT